MRVFIVRHGLTDWNVEGRLQGKSDIPLNETGIEQAQAIANRLRLEKIDAIFSSPLSRAKDTAKAIACYHPNASIIIEKELEEVGFGDAEGLSIAEYTQKYPELTFDARSVHDRYIEKRPGGESIEERVERLLPVVERWKKNYKNKTILLSTHGLTKKCVLLAFQVATYEAIYSLRFDNTALSIIHPFDMEQIELLNDSSHLIHE